MNFTGVHWERNVFKYFMKTDSELTVDDDLMVKSNRIVVLNDIQNHVISISSLRIKDYSK